MRLVRPPATTEIIIQDRNKDTRDDLFESLNLVRERGLSGVTIITIELHLPRSKEFLKMTVDENPSLAGIDVIFIPAEEILAARNQRYARVFSAVQKTKAWQRTQKMEESGVEALRYGRYNSDEKDMTLRSTNSDFRLNRSYGKTPFRCLASMCSPNPRSGWSYRCGWLVGNSAQHRGLQRAAATPFGQTGSLSARW